MWFFAYGWVLGVTLLWVWPVLPSLMLLLVSMAVLLSSWWLMRRYRCIWLFLVGIGLGVIWSTYH
ncbi:MAG: hypothetical protein C0509_05305, partial [Acinetobacter sp.]|nr:hypothetical protein [Acinetobacter sp.]